MFATGHVTKTSGILELWKKQKQSNPLKLFCCEASTITTIFHLRHNWQLGQQSPPLELRGDVDVVVAQTVPVATGAGLTWRFPKSWGYPEFSSSREWPWRNFLNEALRLGDAPFQETTNLWDASLYSCRRMRESAAATMCWESWEFTKAVPKACSKPKWCCTKCI